MTESLALKIATTKPLIQGPCLNIPNRCDTGQQRAEKVNWKPARLKAVLWDMDGTLVDTEPYWIASQRHLAQRFHAVWTEQDEQALIGQPMHVVAAALQARGVDLPTEELTEQRVHYVDSLLSRFGIPWYPGTRRLVRALRVQGIPCAIVSMSPRQIVSSVAQNGPSRGFSTIVTGEDVVRSKPHPESYCKAAAQLGLHPSECVAVEDTRVGAQSADAAGAAVLTVGGVPLEPPAAKWSHVRSLETTTLAHLARIAAGEILNDLHM